MQSGISQINLTTNNNILTERENNKKDFIHIIKKREFSEREKNIICPIKNNKINNKKIKKFFYVKKIKQKFKTFNIIKRIK